GREPPGAGISEPRRSAIAVREEVLCAGFECLRPRYGELERVRQPVHRVEGEGDGERVLDLTAVLARVHRRDSAAISSRSPTDHAEGPRMASCVTAFRW